MSELWTPSDDLLGRDPIAAEQIKLPHDGPELEANGIILPDDLDDERVQLAAAIALAELDDDAPAGDEPGDCEDDDDVEDTDAESVAADV